MKVDFKASSKKNGIHKTQYFPNGSTYKGSFLNNLFDGPGVWRSRFQRYEGMFKEGKFSGSGTLYERELVIYSGQFEKGKYHGCGTCFYKNSSYSGEFVNGRRQGNGIYISCNGESYDGQFFADKKNGKGIEKTILDMYIGDFVDNYRHGIGVLTTKSRKFSGSFFEGSAYSGEWCDLDE
eukprot:NODE_169_length_16247_cov_0.185348.p11 type:complete len:180 gc:universal NODE_169_length_16247_cov_0.185348:15258-14719(-)